MRRSRLVLLVLVALAWFNAGTIWVVQFSCYPLWRDVGKDAFAAYFRFWQQSTRGVVDVPFALAAGGSFLLLLLAWAEFPRWTLWLGVALQAGIEFVRSFLLLPAERHIALLLGQPEASTYGRLIVTNWFLVSMVTAYAILALWMLSTTLAPIPAIIRGRQLLFVTSALGLYAVGNIWFVHLVCYGLWPYVGKQEAYAYHIAWWHSIWGVLFVPAGIVLLGSIAMMRIRPNGVPRSTAWIGLDLQLLVYVITGAWFGPLMARLATPEAGLSLPLYHLLMTTHWARLGLFTAYGLLCCYMLGKGAAGGRWRTA